MRKQSRSARGQIVDFDLMAIKQQLAQQPAPTSVIARRQFIEESEQSSRSRSAAQVSSTGAEPDVIPDILALAITGMEQSADAVDSRKIEAPSKKK